MNKESYEVMIARIKERMFQLGLNARALAEKAGVGKSFIYDVLRGKSTNPTSGKLISIASVLGVSLSYLIGTVDSSVDTASLSQVNVVDIDEAGKVTEVESGLYLFKSNLLFESGKTNLSLCKMLGDDMSPTIKDQELVFFDSSKNILNASGIFVISSGSRLTIRRLEYNVKNSSMIRVIPDNDKYSYYECSNSDIRIFGRVVKRILSI